MGIAFGCIFDFCFEINRFENWRWASNFVIVSTLVIYVILLPIWLLWLSATLKRISNQGGAYTATSAPGETVGNRVDPSGAKSPKSADGHADGFTDIELSNAES